MRKMTKVGAWFLRVGARRVGARRVGARRVAARRSGARRVEARRVGARTVGGPKFRAVLPRPSQISFFLPSVGSFSWNRGRRFGLSGVILCEPRRPTGRWPPTSPNPNSSAAATAATAVARRSGTVKRRRSGGGKKSKEKRNSQGKDPSTSSTWVQCKEWWQEAKMVRHT